MAPKQQVIHAQVHFSKDSGHAYDFCKGLQAVEGDKSRTDAFNEGVRWRQEHSAKIDSAQPEGCGDGYAVNIRYTIL